jgi:hypothetical protein
MAVKVLIAMLQARHATRFHNGLRVTDAATRTWRHGAGGIVKAVGGN